MLRLEDGEPAPLKSTTLTDEEFRERDLQDWIIEQPTELLNDEFLLIGKEVTVKGLGDAIDLLAIDPDGNLVVIELKRGSLKDPVDFQSLKYAAYTAQWDYDHLKNQFETFRSATGSHLFDTDASSQDVLDEFCNEEYSINQDQRIVLVGEDIRERLHLIIQWLADRDIDLTVVSVDLLTDGEQYYLDTDQKIPIPSTSPPEFDPDTSDKPWEADGRTWHMEEITNDVTGSLLENLVSVIKEVEILDGPRWGQKLYVSFRIGRKNRVLLRTQTEQIHLQIYDIDPTKVNANALAERLDIDSGQIVADGQIPGSRRDGVQITCRGDGAADLDAVSEEISQLLGKSSK